MNAVRKCTKLAALDIVADDNAWVRMGDTEVDAVESVGDPRTLNCSHVEVGVWARVLDDGRVLTFSIAYGRTLEGRHTWGCLIDQDNFRWRADLIDPDLPAGMGEATIRWRAVKWLPIWMGRTWQQFADEHKIPERETVGQIVRRAVDRSAP